MRDTIRAGVLHIMKQRQNIGPRLSVDRDLIIKVLNQPGLVMAVVVIRDGAELECEGRSPGEWRIG